jgi:phage portal protein BeeE
MFQEQPVTLLGAVRGDQVFKIERRGRTLMTASLEELLASWESRFGRLI